MYTIRLTVRPLQAVAVLASALALAACSSFNVWPFGSETRSVVRAHDNAAEYRCDGNKSFHVRLLDNGNAAWLILPERQLRLERKGEGQYSNGIATLKLDAGTLDDTSVIAWRNCKPAAK